MLILWPHAIPGPILFCCCWSLSQSPLFAFDHFLRSFERPGDSMGAEMARGDDINDARTKQPTTTCSLTHFICNVYSLRVPSHRKQGDTREEWSGGARRQQHQNITKKINTLSYTKKHRHYPLSCPASPLLFASLFCCAKSPSLTCLKCRIDQMIGIRIEQQQMMSTTCRTFRHLSHTIEPGAVSSSTICATLFST